jgi:hypothetical protein
MDTGDKEITRKNDGYTNVEGSAGVEIVQVISGFIHFFSSLAALRWP